MPNNPSDDAKPSSQRKQPYSIPDLLMQQFEESKPHIAGQGSPVEQPVVHSETSGLTLEEEVLLQKERQRRAAAELLAQSAGRPAEGMSPSSKILEALAQIDEGDNEALLEQMAQPPTRPAPSRPVASAPLVNATGTGINPEEENLLPKDINLSEMTLDQVIRKMPPKVEKPKQEAPAQRYRRGPEPYTPPANPQPITKASAKKNFEVDAMMKDDDGDVDKYLAPKKSYEIKQPPQMIPVSEQKRVEFAPDGSKYIYKEDLEQEWEEEMSALKQMEERKPVLESDDYAKAVARLVEERKEAPDYMPPLPQDSVLYKICALKREHVQKRKSMAPEVALIEKIRRMPIPRDFNAAIQRRVKAGQVALIAEIKKASPSKGIIRENFKPGEIADAYTQAGAACLSVLTDEPYFQGSDENVNLAKAVSPLPVLRKDFILDPYQVVESRFIGADCILLIMAALSDNQARELEEKARQMNLAVLVEVHNEEEMQRALHLHTKLIGINNRDLKTLTVDLSTTERLVQLVPPGYTIVCESGISNYQEILRMEECDVHTFLVGESLMVQEDIVVATKTLLNIL